jgi:hypothetical protein
MTSVPTVRGSRLARGALALAAIGAIAALLSGPGYRLQLWSLRTAFVVLASGAGAGIGAALLALVAAVVTRPVSHRAGFGLALAAGFVGIATSAWPAFLFWQAKALPAIHDVTTDTTSPPRFVAVARTPDQNPAEYGGAAVAALQRAAYPDIATFDSPLPPGSLHDRAVTVARAMGWTLASDEPGQGRIEASDRTFFFGFVDDVVIRIVPRGTGSRLDIRSASRIGKSDVGANARRIRAFLQRLANA